MIDNPLPDQVMQEKETLQNAQDFDFYCNHHAKEIATHYKVHEDLHEDFAEWFQDYMSQNPDLFDHTCIMLDDSYIKDWWECNGEYFDDFPSPYEYYEPTDQEMMSSFGTKWHDKL